MQIRKILVHTAAFDMHRILYLTDLSKQAESLLTPLTTVIHPHRR